MFNKHHVHYIQLIIINNIPGTALVSISKAPLSILTRLHDWRGSVSHKRLTTISTLPSGNTPGGRERETETNLIYLYLIWSAWTNITQSYRGRTDWAPHVNTLTSRLKTCVFQSLPKLLCKYYGWSILCIIASIYLFFVAQLSSTAAGEYSGAFSCWKTLNIGL